MHLSKEPEQSKEAIIAEELRNGEMNRKRKKQKKKKHYTHSWQRRSGWKTAKNKVKSAKKRKLHIRTQINE